MRKSVKVKTGEPATMLASFSAHQQKLDLLRFITCGSKDDGKSTLIARLVREYGQLDEIDCTLPVDALAAGRERVDVIYHCFASDKRKFMVADIPSHEQYNRNMISGAAAVALILVDATQGFLSQSRHHAYLLSLMGIRHVVLAVNKMDSVAYDEAVFEQIYKDFSSYAQNLNFTSMNAIPLSALKGDNVISRSPQTPWYTGATLMGCLESIDFTTPPTAGLVFPVQEVNYHGSGLRSYSGTLEQGSVALGDEIRITASGQTAKISDIVTMDGSRNTACQGQAVTLKLATEIDASRGDIISLAQQPLQMTDQFEATLVWMNEEEGLIGRSYDLILATQSASASISAIKHKINVNTLAQEAARTLTMNDISICTVSLNKAIVCDRYEQSRILGGFILVDKFNHATVAAGMISHSLRRAQNIHKQALSIDRIAREKQNGHKGQVIWFTGLSGSGKSTLANALEVALHAQGYRTYLLDGDNVRGGLNKDLGFTDADRVENIRRITEVAKLMMDAGMIVMTAFISPFRRERDMARELIGAENFVEVYVDTTLDVCELRDVKGLYKKARAGQLPNLTGIGSAYEAPTTPEITINGGGNSIEVTAEKLLTQLTRLQAVRTE